MIGKKIDLKSITWTFTLGDYTKELKAKNKQNNRNNKNKTRN